MICGIVKKVAGDDSIKKVDYTLSTHKFVGEKHIVNFTFFI